LNSDVEEVLAHPLAGFLDIGGLCVSAFRFDFVIARQGFKGLPLAAFERVAAEHEDAVAGDVAAGSRVENIVPDLALQADVGDETLKGLRIESRTVVGVRVAVRIAVLAIEE